jgi:ribulose-5-phosphate 4-epimerase/fuculose-1-phosphate aldolase
MTAEADRKRLSRQLMIAYRIFAAHGVLDIEGHISVRHPDNPELFIMGRHVPADTLTEADLLTLNQKGEVVAGSGSAVGERLVHAGIFLSRPDVQVICHSHTPSLIPFGVTGVPLRPLYQWAARMGYEVPVWDSADEFGDTSMSISTIEMAQSIARTMGDGRVALLRGHGAVFTAGSLPELALLGVYTHENAQLLATAHVLGGGKVRSLSPGEVQKCNDMLSIRGRTVRPWQAWSAALGLPDEG